VRPDGSLGLVGLFVLPIEVIVIVGIDHHGHFVFPYRAPASKVRQLQSRNIPFQSSNQIGTPLPLDAPPFGKPYLSSWLMKGHVTDRLIADLRTWPILIIKRIGKAVVGILHFKDAIVLGGLKCMLGS